MSLQHKQVFQRMNLDLDVRRLKPGEHRKLINGISVSSRLSSYPSADGIISNVAGNSQQSQGGTAALPTGANRVVGFLEDRVGQRSFYFVSDGVTAANDAIYQYVLGSGITLVMRSSLLGLLGSTFVSADIVGDLLTFTTGLGDPLQINVTDAIAGGVYTPVLQEISLIKRAPKSPLSIASTGASRTVNNLRYNTFQFFWRFIYQDDAYSVFSPVSEAMQPTASNYDAVIVTTPTANIPATVTKIEYAFKKNGTNELTIYRSDSVPLGASSHYFYNDTNLETVDDVTANKWYDPVPLKSKALKFHENRLFMFGNTEGYTLTGTQLTGATAGTTGISGVGRVLKDDSVYGVSVQFYDWAGRIIGNRKVGDVATARRDSSSTSLAANKILVDLSSVATANIPEDAYDFSVLRTKNKSVSFFLSSVTADIFFRKLQSDGTYIYSKSAPLYDELMIDISNLIKLEMGYTYSQGDRIKIWKSDGTTVLDLPISSQDGNYIFARHSEVGPTTTWLDATQGDVLIFEIYTPKQNNAELFYEVGHRASISNPGSGTRAFSSTSIVISGDVYIAPRAVVTSSTGPTATSYYKFYDDLGSGYTPTGPFANDESIRTAGTGGITFPDKFYSFAPEAKNPNWSIWADGVGRGIDYVADGARQIDKKTIKWSSEYIQNSRLLGINTFNALDEQYLAVNNGTPVALTYAEKVLIALFDIQSIALYVGEGFINTAEGNQFLAKTDSVIGDDRPYSGNYGTTRPATVVSRNSRVYWLDTKKQVVLRRAQDGLTVISDYGIKNLISTLCEAYRGVTESNVRITAGWDPQYECYTLCFNNLLEQDIEDSMTLYFHESTNSWVCMTDLRPEFFGIVLNRQLHFLNGALWVQVVDSQYNNFFGTQYDRLFEWEIGQDSLEKIWEAIEVDCELLYSTAGTNETIVELYGFQGDDLQNRINYLDFVQRGSAWRSSFFRNLNDANFASTTLSKYKSSHNTRGQSAFLTITYNGTDRNHMKSITVFYRPSMYSTP